MRELPQCVRWSRTAFPWYLGLMLLSARMLNWSFWSNSHLHSSCRGDEEFEVEFPICRKSVGVVQRCGCVLTAFVVAHEVFGRVGCKVTEAYRSWQKQSVREDAMQELSPRSTEKERRSSSSGIRSSS